MVRKQYCITFTTGPGDVSSRTCAQMLRTFSKCENNCSAIATRERSLRAGHTSSCLEGAELDSSSPAHGLFMHFGAAA